MKNITIKCKLNLQVTDFEGYTTYVFESTDGKQYSEMYTKYLMVVKFPNWDCKEIKEGEEGFLNYNIIKEGEDTYYDKTKEKLIKYKYSNFQFVQFIPLINKTVDNKIILD